MGPLVSYSVPLANESSKGLEWFFPAGREKSRMMTKLCYNHDHEVLDHKKLSWEVQYGVRFLSLFFNRKSTHVMNTYVEVSVP